MTIQDVVWIIVYSIAAFFIAVFGLVIVAGVTYGIMNIFDRRKK